MYETCISLGWFCGVASSMGRYGLRKHSGPFDWYFSEFAPVLKVMETDFSDFMVKENLVTEQENATSFHDKKYGFGCVHDVEEDFETEYPFIYQKYKRRVERFREDIKRPTCFIRSVKSEQELAYIEENEKYIKQVIQKGNKENTVIFLLLNDMRGLSADFRWFRLGIDRYIGEAYEMRIMFDSSKEFSAFCRESILPKEALEHNREFDKLHLSKNAKGGLLMAEAYGYKEYIVPALEQYYPDIEHGIYLWGLGLYGKRMLEHLLENKIRILGLIDNDPKKKGSFLEGIPVVSLEEIGKAGKNIFITIASGVKTARIEKQILAQNPAARILKLTDVYDWIEKESGLQNRQAKSEQE